MKKNLINISIIILSVIITIGALELILRAVYKFKASPRGLARIPVAKTYRLSENKKLLYELLPNSKVKNKGVEFKINSSGFRDKDYQARKPRKTRLICVGDSITYGWTIPLEDTYHKQLERLFRSESYDVDVMGMGVVGYNTVQEYHLIKDKALDFNPDMIILQIAMNDFERTVTIRTYQEGRRLSLRLYHDYAIPFIIKKTTLTYSLMKNSHLFKFINLKLFWLKNKKNPAYTPRDMYLMGEEDAFHHLRKIKSLLDSMEIRLAAVIFPFRKGGDAYPYTTLHAKIHKELEKMEVPTLDLQNILNTDTEDNLWEDKIHPTVKGHEVVSHALFKFLQPLLQNN